MTVAEYITLWDSINNSTIPFIYYYKNKKILKHKLYNINDTLKSIKLICKQEDINEYDITIYHDTLTCFNYDQQKFYDALHLEIPDNTVVNTIHFYIE